MFSRFSHLTKYYDSYTFSDMQDSAARTALLDAAIDELPTLSPTFGARAIARKAGVNHGLVPYYFKDAAGLLLATVERAVSDYFQVFEDLTRFQDGENKVASVTDWALEVLRTDPAHFARRRAIFALSQEHPVIGDKVRNLIEKEIEMTATFIANVRGRGQSNVKDVQAAKHLVALFDGLATHGALGIEADADGVRIIVEQIVVGGRRA